MTDASKPISLSTVKTERGASAPRLVALGLFSSLLFCSTWIFNKAVSLGGGHWVWNGALRWGLVVVLLALWIGCRHGWGHLGAVLRLFRARPVFWIITGTLGGGMFYAGVCFAADHAPAWVTASTWQITILFSPLVLRLFGYAVPLRGIAFGVLIVFGVGLVNLNAWQQGIALDQVLLGVIPILISALVYPIGNQRVSNARYLGLPGLPKEATAVLADASSCVFLVALGSVPFWLALVAVVQPPPPSAGQALSALVVALSSGMIGTTIYVYARNRTSDPYLVAAVDATQAGEILFTLLLEVVFLQGTWPDLVGVAGFVLVLGGLIGFAFASGRK